MVQVDGCDRRRLLLGAWRHVPNDARAARECLLQRLQPLDPPRRVGRLEDIEAAPAVDRKVLVVLRQLRVRVNRNLRWPAEVDDIGVAGAWVVQVDGCDRRRRRRCHRGDRRRGLRA